MFCITGRNMSVVCVALALISKAMASTVLTEDCICKVVERCEYDYMLNVVVIYIYTSCKYLLLKVNNRYWNICRSFIRIFILSYMEGLNPKSVCM